MAQAREFAGGEAPVLVFVELVEGLADVVLGGKVLCVCVCVCVCV